MSFLTPIDQELTRSQAFSGSKVDALTEQARRLAKDTTADKEKIGKVAAAFEGIFIEMMLKQMRKTTWDEGSLGSSMESKTYREMFDSEVAAECSKSGRFGFAKMIREYLTAQMRVEGSTQEEKAGPQPVAETGTKGIEMKINQGRLE